MFGAKREDGTMQGSEPAKTAQAPGASADEAVDEAERGLSLSFARTLSWLSLVVVLLTSLGLSFFISNSARQTLMHRQENFITVLTQNLNNQIFQRFAVPTIVAYGRISLREAPQYERLDKVVKSVIEGLPVTARDKAQALRLQPRGGLFHHARLDRQERAGAHRHRESAGRRDVAA